MGIRNAHWYDRNEGIKYPLDDQATAVDDAGKFLPSSIVGDINLRWPTTLGPYAYLSAVSVTDSLVTVVLLAASDLDDVGLSPLAVLSVPRPVDQNRVYALLPQAAGVGGWIVFGPGVEDANYRGRFSSPRQSLLSPRAARAYRPLPVSSMEAWGADVVLSGTVHLSVLPPLAIAKEQRTIEGVLRDCIVVRLTDTAGGDGYPVPAQASLITGYQETSTFFDYAGPCAGRPESGTCGDPQPIEGINGVQPDCDGIITIQFLGCAEVAQIVAVSECGVLVDCGLGLAQACPAPQIPNSDGILPDEFTPINIKPPVHPEPPPVPGQSESLQVSGLLPHLDCFLDGIATDFVIAVGLWTYVADGGPYDPCRDEFTSESHSGSDPDERSESGSAFISEPGGRTLISLATNTASSRNVVLWEGTDDTTLNRVIQTDLKMEQGPLGAKHNGGIVLNYRAHPTNPGQFIYYLAEVDFDNQQFRISRWNGTNFVAVLPYDLPMIEVGTWYRINVVIRPAPTPGQVILTARLTSPDSPGEIDTLLTATVSDYLPSAGRFGFASNRAITYFSYIMVDNA